MSPKSFKKNQTPPKPQSMALFLAVQGAVLLFSWAIARSIMGDNSFYSFALSSGILYLCFLSVSLTIHWMFLKKSIALIVAGIVFKWPILIFAVILVTRLFDVQNGPVALGAFVWFPAAIVAHFLDRKG